MEHLSLHDHIDRLEERVNLLATTVVDGSPNLLQSVSGDLQSLAVELKHLLEANVRNPLEASGLATRVRLLAAVLATVREGLLRQSAYVDRALELIVPHMQQKSTYPGSKAYGAPVRQSGAFSVLSA